jgi:osmotically-inducible protein OsmY
MEEEQMNSPRTNILKTAAASAAALCLVAAFSFAPATAADMKEPDLLVTSMAKISLMTAENVHIRDINVDTVNGVVTLHGKVPTEAEKARAESVVKSTQGVKSVQNLLQVVPEAKKDQVEEKDDVVKERVKKALDAADDAVDGVSVASVNKGVVLLSGKVSLSAKLRAIEIAYDVPGVRRVASEIEIQS